MKINRHILTRQFLCLFLLITILLSAIALPVKTFAQSSQNFSFDSFSADYYLSRDNSHHSLLKTDETFIARFPSGSNYTGIQRILPQQYQGHSVELKLLSIKDGNGRNYPYKTHSDQKKNLVIDISDPDITVYGPQTYKISYQARNVTDQQNDRDELLLNINGYGWAQAFGEVTARIHVDKNLRAALKNSGTCYMGYESKTSGSCQISRQSSGAEEIITATSAQLEPYQALRVYLDFNKGTFAQTPQAGRGNLFERHKTAILITLPALLLIVFLVIMLRRYRV